VARFLEIQDQEGYYVFDNLSQTYLAIEYEEDTRTWVFVQQDKRTGKWTAVDTFPTIYQVGRKYCPTSVRAADIDDSSGSHTPAPPQTQVSTTMSQTVLSTAAAALTLAGTTAPKQTSLEKGRFLRDSHRVQVDPQEDLEVEAFQEDPQLGEDLSNHQEVVPQAEPQEEFPEEEEMAN
jgi:hypothetical protein